MKLVKSKLVCGCCLEEIEAKVQLVSSEITESGGESVTVMVQDWSGSPLILNLIMATEPAQPVLGCHEPTVVESGSA